jgi:hypothetical protein
MLSEKNKKTVALILALISFLLNAIIALPYDPISMLCYKVRLYYWSWIPAIILPSATIVTIISLKLESKILRGFTLFLSILGLLIGIIWLSLLLFVANITP